MKISQETAEQSNVLQWLRVKLPQNEQRRSLINQILEMVSSEPANDYGLFREEDAQSMARATAESKLCSLTTYSLEYIRDTIASENGASAPIRFCDIIDALKDTSWQSVFQGECGIRVLVRFRMHDFADREGQLLGGLKPLGSLTHLRQAARGIDLSRIGPDYQLADVLMKLVVIEDMYLEDYLLDFIDGDIARAEAVLDYCESRDITPGRINMSGLESYVSTAAASLREGSL